MQQVNQLLVVVLICVGCGLFVFLANPAPVEQRRDVTPEKKEVWLLYHAGWGNMDVDGTWGDWRLRKAMYSEIYFDPPAQLPVIHQPQLGIYSSHNESVLLSHLKMIKEMDVDVLVVPWDGPSSFSDVSLDMLFELCPQFKLKLVPMIAVKERRNQTLIEEWIRELKTAHTDKETWHTRNGKHVLIVYDSHRIATVVDVVTAHNDLEIMGAPLTHDGLLDAYEEGFAGSVSFFAGNETSWMSGHKNWQDISRMCRNRGMLFVPTVSPGYNESTSNRWSIRAWNSRRCGAFYDERWKAALEANTNVIMINSWNYWPDGSVIEPVVDSERWPLSDNIWCGHDPYFFVRKTTDWIRIFKTGEGQQ